MTLAVALISFLTLSVFSSLEAEGYTFTPPIGWDQADKSLLARRVEVSFFEKSIKEFRPSINIAKEEVSVSLEQYVKSVQKIHEAAAKNRWRKLGDLRTDSGTAILTSLDMETAAGPIRLLQAFFLDNGTAYIITGAASQEDFPIYQSQFLQAFRSFSINYSSE